jgi:hypothetical protein
MLATSPFSGNIDGCPRPLKPDESNSEIVEPSAVPRFIDSLGAIDQAQCIGRDQQSSETFLRPATRNPILDWYTSQEKPWDPLQGRTVQPLSRPGDLPSGKLNYHRLNGAVYSSYQEPRVPSDCETIGPGALPSDSGYHSRATQSIFTGSTCGDADRGGENGSISSHLAGLQVDRPSFSAHSWEQASIPTTPLPFCVGNGDLVCPTCQFKAKTKSGLKYVLLSCARAIPGTLHAKKHFKETPA